jgi:hypothetical protein
MFATVRLKVFGLSRLISKNLKSEVYIAVILLLVLYECETWSLVLGEEHRLQVSENRVLISIFGPKREEVAEG